MNRSLVALVALAVSHAALVLALVVASRQLPVQVASHFNGAGAPNGWMSRSAYLWTMGGMSMALSLVVLGSFYGVRYFRPSVINLPNRDHWLAPERRAETFDALSRAGVWLASLTATLILGVHLQVVAANNAQPVVLSSDVWLLLAGYVAAILCWTFGLIHQFYRTG